MNERFDRQGFLGSRSEELLRTATIAIIGLGGGGSHIAQQLGHLGVGNLILFDPDRIEYSNLNRLVGASTRDADDRAYKVEVAARLIQGINPATHVISHSVQWQVAADDLREADIAISCLDSYAARQDIEVSARRFLIPLVDIGMDVHQVGGKAHISGQVIVSMPSGPCFRCLGFLNDENLRQEAQQYGAAGGRPQGVWAHGVLASIAGGLVVEMLTGWTNRPSVGEYIHYDGNENLTSRSPRLLYAPKMCPHYQDLAIGEPSW